MSKTANYKNPKYLSSKKKRNGDIYLLILEGENTEFDYINYLKSQTARNSRIHIDTIKNKGCDIQAMYNTAKEYLDKSRKRVSFFSVPYKKVFIVIDKDHFSNSSKFGVGKKALCDVINIIKNDPIELVISAPNFEYWFLLHFDYLMPNNDNLILPLLEKSLKEHNIIPEDSNYSKKSKHSKKIAAEILKNDRLNIALDNAKKVEDAHIRNGIDRLDRDPYTEVHNMIKELELNA